MPARGDFLGRRVPPGLAAPWEAWLQGMTAAARLAAPEGWPEPWLTAPLWHFALGAAVAPPHGAAGVLVASADRVGRLFPFTVVGAAGAPGSGGAVPLADWSRAVEALVLGALEDGFDPDRLDAALVRLGPPRLVAVPERPVGLWPIEAGPEDAATADAGWGGDDDGPGPGQSVWWCRGSDRIAAVRLRCAGLPAGGTAAAMVVGGAAITPGGPDAYWS